MASDTQSDSMKSSKKQPQQKKVLDVSRPKKRPATTGPATAPQLVIPKRSVMVTVADSPSTSTDPVTPNTPETTASTTATPATPKRVAKIIEPSTAPEVNSSTGTADQAASSTENVSVKTEPAQSSTTPEPKQDATQTPEAPAADVDEAQATDTTAEDTSDESETSSTDAAAKPSDGDVRKALEDAKREEEIRGYIDKHEFFVPINSIARKRNIKVTLALVLLELLLGLFLLNLMLDAGLIYLLQKIPHTHFFDLQ